MRAVATTRAEDRGDARTVGGYLDNSAERAEPIPIRRFDRRQWSRLAPCNETQQSNVKVLQTADSRN